MALMSRLLEQMVKDEQLQPAVQSVIAQLQPSVLRVAIHDPRLLRTDKHPAWRFANEVASYANGHTGPKQSGLSSFMAFVQPLVQELAQNTARRPFSSKRPCTRYRTSLNCVRKPSCNPRSKRSPNWPLPTSARH